MRRFAVLGFCCFLLLFASASLRYSGSGPFTEGLSQVWQQIALPFRLARLSAQPPDKTLVMPVEGVQVRQVSDTWGAPRPNGRRHQGQDIFAPRGTPVYAAVPGFVVRVADSGLGGKHVFVTGAGGRRYYFAHLDDFAAIAVGDEVSVDTVLGYVGNTGNAIATPPHLHFGVYTAQGAVDPLPLLVDRSPPRPEASPSAAN